MIDNTSPYALTEKPKGNPPEGFAFVECVTSHYRRSVNGAWLGNGATTNHYKVPLAEIPGWLSPGSTGGRYVTFPDGTSVSVDGGSTPVRGYGWGPLGQIEVTDQWGAKRKELVQLCPNLPGCGLSYYGVRQFTAEALATFTTDYKI